MEFYISHVPTRATEYTVTKAIADQVLHKCPGLFLADRQQRLPNFKVTLNPDDRGGVRNNGTGALTLTTAIGAEFLALYNQGNITAMVDGRQLVFHPSGRPVDAGLEMTLERAPFIDPDIAQERQKKIDALQDRFCVCKVQIGTFYRPDNAGPCDSRAFSIEWETDLKQRSMAWLKFEYDHKLMRVEIGDPATESTRYDVVVKFHNIAKMALGCSFGEHHKDRYGRDVLNRFYNFCVEAGLRPPIRHVMIDASKQEFFNNGNLHHILRWLVALCDNWPIAFQIQALLNNGIAHTRDVLKLRPRIDELISRHGSIAGEVMRYFVEAAANRPTVQPLQKCFEAILQRQLRRRQFTAPDGRFFCHHVTITPTRRLLEGPNIMQANRVLREFKGYEDYFLRVAFRDEDHLQYRWTRDVDGETFLRERVGKVLKEGFDIAGRHFSFLAYSSSALKTHAVWFVTAESIRATLGNFETVVHSPSKYGARMAQAFTATDPSVKLHKSQWTTMPDICQNGIVFTDGIGTMSQELATLIWQTLCRNYSDNGANAVQPAAYQIRFLGYKGMVAVDPLLKGIHMCLRPSMKKFDVEGKDFAEIEIASSFGKPMTVRLNRPLVMVLEDRGVPMQVFLELQEQAVSNTRRADESVSTFIDLLEDHKLCKDFWVPDILRRLNSSGSELNLSQMQPPLDTPFLSRLRSYAINHVLRDIKYHARVPVPDSYMLPGVADEGPAHVKRGLPNVYCLPQGKIFACIQNPGDNEPTWLRGPCVIFRNPVMHPGDVQFVEAIGEPPRNCLFAKLKNVVVFPAQGTRSLPNSLAGGDLDGDTYAVVQYGPLLDLRPQKPGAYPPVTPFTLGRPSTVNDVCDFIVEYIHSDVVISRNQAVDYPKNGHKVKTHDLPRALVPFKPDWHQSEQPEQSNNLKADYYESSRALGYMYRSIELEKLPDGGVSDMRSDMPSTDRSWEDIASVYTGYQEELIYISTTYSLSKTALSEEELVIGTVLANCSNREYKKDRVYAMKESLSFLLRVTREALVGELHEDQTEEIAGQLARAWKAWNYTLDIQRASNDSGTSLFGSHSFGLIALGLVLECLARMGSLPL
ncbi:RNA dependent RNA polymerase-domain-containing protein [Pisolithus marmoratus]|nr:RNA dependent RNA polymerase-domain-containing protein [Pisolithus marmoratus]